MIRIFKYPIIPGEATQEIEVPAYAVMVSGGLDANGQLCIWMSVDDKQEQTEKRLIYCIGTGWPLDLIIRNDYPKFDHLATVADGPYVWHLFDGGVKWERYEEDLCKN